MGVIPPATDLAPACIWEECDLTIRLFQAHPCLTSTSLSLKPSSVKRLQSEDKGMQQEGKEERLSWGEKILQTYSSFPIFSLPTSLSPSQSNN